MLLNWNASDTVKAGIVLLRRGNSLIYFIKHTSFQTTKKTGDWIAFQIGKPRFEDIGNQNGKRVNTINNSPFCVLTSHFHRIILINNCE